MCSSELTPSTPRDAALHILHAWFGTAPGVTLPEWLQPHQHEAVQRLLHVLQRRRGVILADSVGLGKTHIALGVINQWVQQRRSPLLVIPAVLQNHWQQHLRLLNAPVSCDVLTHTALSRGYFPEWLQPRLIIVDEAHQFRNPHTRRYRALRRLSNGAQLLLISATPVNNDIQDLWSLLNLFASDGDFHDIGVPSLRAAFSGDPRLGALERVLAEVVVRRTRAALPELREHFPERQLRSLRYDFDDDTSSVIDRIARLDLVWTSQPSAHAADLVRLQLLKRLESSRAALYCSLLRLRAIAQTCLTLLDQGLLPELAAVRSELPVDGDLQLSFDQLLYAPSGHRSIWRRPAVEADLRRLHEAVALSARGIDPKLECLRAHLRRLHGQRVLIFTQFRDTAEHLWLMLRREWRVGLVTGEESWLGEQQASRTAVVSAFSNRSIGRRHEIDLLIATDVLAEGMNLQAGSTVINYDLPWNPVTLMQRAGRIDRFGSPYDRIEVVSLLPDRGLERWLNLMRTLERKLDGIRRTVGIDQQVLMNGLNGESPSREFAALDALERLRRHCSDHRATRIGNTVIAAFEGPADVTLVAVKDPRLRLLCLTHDGTFEDLTLAAELLERALGAEPCELRSFDEAALTRWLRSEAHMRVQPVDVTETRAGISRWLGSHLARAENRPDLVRRVEALTRRLCREPPPAVDLSALAALGIEPGLACLEKAWNGRPIEAPRHVEYELVGVIQQVRKAAEPALTKPGNPVNFIRSNDIPA